jgi:hypothetical protein
MVEGAGRVIGGHPDRFVIVTTHADLHSDGTRFDFAKFEGKLGYNPKNYRLSKADGTFTVVVPSATPPSRVSSAPKAGDSIPS